MDKFDSFCESAGEKIKKICSAFYKKAVSLNDSFSKNSRANLIFIFVIAAVSFALMFLMNSNTPYVAEDFDYHYIFADDGRKVTETLVSSVGDIITSMKAHYYTMNGRIITHSLVQLIMMLENKPLFNVLNSLVYVLFTFVIYKHCIGKSKKHSAVVFLFVNLAVWAFTPQWGLTTVWLLGSVNYLWMSTVRLSFLLVFRLYAEDGTDRHTVLKTVLMFFLAFVAGSTSENMGAALIGVTVLIIFYCRAKKYKFMPWFATSFIGEVAGYLFMFLAPANSVRVGKEGENGNSILSRIINIPSNFVYYLAPLIGLGILFALVLVFNKKKPAFGLPLIFFLGAVGSAGVMVAIPFFPQRAWFGSVIYTIIAVGMLLYRTCEIEKLYRQLVSVSAVFCMLWAMTSYLKAFDSAQKYMDAVTERAEYIEEQKKEGNYDLEFANITLMNKHAPMYSWTDIGKAPDDPQHISIAQYYGLNSVDWNGEYIIID